MKNWLVDYAARRADGSYFEDRIRVDADTIKGAVSAAEAMLCEKACEAGWKTWVIWDVGIVSDLDEEVC